MCLKSVECLLVWTQLPQCWCMSGVLIAVLPPPQIYISNKWGFTKWTKEQYQEMMQDGRLIPDGVHAQYKPDRGPLAEWRKRQAA